MRLTEWFDDEVEHEGVTYSLDLDFYVVLTVFEILQDKDLTEHQKVVTAVELLTGIDGIDLSPDACAELLELVMIKHINIDDTEDTEPQLDIMGNPMPVWQPKASYSFTHDAKYIYSSFIQAYDMDLFEQRGRLHWRKFLALFEGLPSGTMMMQVISIRQMDVPKGKGSEEDALKVRQLKKQYALPK